MIADRGLPVVNFLDGLDASSDDEVDIPACFHFSSTAFARSPRIPVVIEGVRVPMLLDTGAEVTIVSTSFVQHLFPGKQLPDQGREVRSLAGTRTALGGPIPLTIELCGLTLNHPVYFCENVRTFLFGYDLISAAVLVIDTEARCVWSKLTASWGDVQSFANSVVSTVVDPQTTTSVSESTTCDAITVASDRDLPPCESLRSSYYCIDSVVSPTTTVTDLDDSAQATVGSQPTSHCNGVSTSLDPSAPLFIPLSASSLVTASVSSEPHCTEVDKSLNDFVPHASVTATPVSDSCLSAGADTLPVVGTFLHNNSSELEVDDETQLKVIKPSLHVDDIVLPDHVNVLYVNTLEDTDLPDETTAGLKRLLHDHQGTFAKSSTDLGFCPIVQHDIDTGDTRPIKQSPRRPPISARDAEDEILDEMLEAGVIEPSRSEWASPVCLVKKKDGTYRFCIDYRRVNAVSRKDAFPIPDIQDALDNLRGSKYYITMDLLSGYWQLPMSTRAKERSAFCTKRGLFQFTRMPFGLSGAPGSFCRLMSIALRDLLWKVCLCYLDDIVIYARTPEELLERFRIVLDRLREVGLKVKPSKCELFKKEIKFLGHMVSANGIDPLPEKLETIRNWPTPHCLRDVRAFFGLASYYRRFVRGFATMAEPLTRLTRKQARFEWTDEAQQAFDALKLALMEATSLAFPHPNLPCLLDTDASDVAHGAVLAQVIDGVERPIAFFSRVMNAAQRGYCTTRRELLAVISALQHFRHYLLGNKVILRTDHHSLKWLETFKRPEGILARWVETLAEFDFEIEHRPGRLHSNVDGVSRQFCKQCLNKATKIRWVDELDRADELTEPLGVHSVAIAPEISDAEMREFQAEDPDLGPVIGWLQSEQPPTSDIVRQQSLEARGLWGQVPTVHLLDGILVRKLPDKETVQLVVPHRLRKSLFDMTHSGPLAAHLGSQKTYLQLKSAYYWPGLKRDVTTWCRECDICAQCKGPPTRRQGRLQKVFTGAPLDVVAVDILSGLPPTPDGMKYILVLTDYFTKWACAFALPDAEASTCMRVMYNSFFAHFGLPRQIHSDLGKNFESRLFHELCSLVGTAKTHTTPFHPQSDGQAERLVKSVVQMLRAVAQDHPETWPQRLPTVMAAYRMTVHKTTGVTPNMAMLGREVMLPATLIARPPEEFRPATVPFVRDLRDALREAHQRVRDATKSSARTQKRYYDERSKQTPFHEKQLVWLFWPRPPVRQKYRKLQKLWTGPWQIESFKTPLVVVLKHTLKRSRQTVHVDRLLPCNTPPETDSGVPPDVSTPTDEQDSRDSQPWDDTQSQSQSVLDSSRPVRTRRRPAALDNYILS